MLAQRLEAVIALDWTDFEADDQETLVASLVTRHGRSTPLMWTTLVKSASKGNRQLAEDLMLEKLRASVSPEAQVTIVADRGFADVELYALLDKLGFHYVVRFRADVRVMAADGESKLAREWVPEGGRAKLLRGARVTATKRPVNAVVCVRRKGMKEAWCLATSLEEGTAQEVMDVYGRRFTTEETFRDVKDLKFVTVR